MLSILIVSYNCKPYIHQCIKSIEDANINAFPLEVVIVDNCSTDGSVELLNSFQNAKFNFTLKIIINKKNVGFGRGMNIAFRQSSGNYIFSFNPDAEVIEGMLEKGVSFLDKNEAVGKLGFLTKHDDGRLSYPYSQFHRFGRPNLIRIFFPEKEKRLTVPFEVNWLFGTGIMIRKSAVNENFLYDERTFLFVEEFWLSKMVRLSGFKIFIHPDLFIRHHAGVTYKFNYSKKYKARVLLAANEWMAREEEYGVLNANLNTVIKLLDSIVLYTLLYLKRIFTNKDDNQLKLEVIEHEIELKARWRILTRIPKSIPQLNNEIMENFNASKTE